MALTLYFNEFSPAVRATLLTIKALDLSVNYKEINLTTGEHLQPDYVKKNPLHTIPTLEDGDFIVYDSHAINSYLVDKYANNDALYPKDLNKRAIVNQMMFFDASVLFPRTAAIAISVFREGAKSVSKDKADFLIQGYNSLETLLENNNPYIAGADVTIADFSVTATMTSSNVFVPIASNRFPNISEYITRMQALPYYKEGNQNGLEKLTAFVRSKLA